MYNESLYNDLLNYRVPSAGANDVLNEATRYIEFLEQEKSKLDALFPKYESLMKYFDEMDDDKNADPITRKILDRIAEILEIER